MKPAAIIFDLDGTLVDSIPDIAGAMNRVLKSHNLELLTEDQYRRIVGHGLRNLAETVVNKADLAERILGQFMELYSQHCVNHTRPYRGIPEALKNLREKGIKLAVLSNKTEILTRKVVDFTLPGLLDMVTGLTDDKLKKPHPHSALKIASEFQLDPATIVFIGDSPVDMETAVNAGMTPIGASWGYREPEELIKSGAVHILISPDHLSDPDQWRG